MHSLWLGPAPLLLASKSPARRALLAAAQIPFEACDSGIDERAVEAPLRAQGAAPEAIAAALAQAKSLAVASQAPGRLVVGADQTLSLEGKLFAKPATLAEARAQLLSFSGRSHFLHSALCVSRDGQLRFATVEIARLTCRPFGEDFVDRYIAAAGDKVLASVGAYQIEGLGLHLFETIAGDHATILGLPMLPLLAFLRREHWLAT